MLKKSYNRTRKMKYLLFSNKKKVERIVYTEFLKKNKIHDIIKFTRNEFKLEKKEFFLLILISIKLFIKKEKIFDNKNI